MIKMPNDQEIFLPDINEKEIITDRHPHLLAASKLLARINPLQNEFMIFGELMQAVWNDELHVYTLRMPQDDTKSEYDVKHGVLIRTALDPKTGLPIADDKGREDPGEIVEDWQRVERPRETLLQELRILAVQPSFGGVGPEYKAGPEVWVALAARRPRSYDPHMVCLGRLRASPEDLVEWCRRNGLEPWAAWLRSTPITGGPASQPPAKLQPTRKACISEAKLKEWLSELVRTYRGDASSPGCDTSYKMAKKEFPDCRIPREMFRRAWKEHTPIAWHKSGPKRKPARAP